MYSLGAILKSRYKDNEVEYNTSTSSYSLMSGQLVFRNFELNQMTLSYEGKCFFILEKKANDELIFVVKNDEIENIS